MIESLFEDYQFDRLENGATWCDSTLIASKPPLSSKKENDIFYNNLLKINSTLPANSNDAVNTKETPLVALKKYEVLIKKPFLQALFKRLLHQNIKKRLFHYW